ncbi:MAG: glutamate--tRNA ligase [Candidatus ainarchaeum sp.]|nr:glutamate--tRNA ligase [Candidatus ainarchaeum sp.]
MAKEIIEDAYRYAIKNAFSHNGKADASAVVGKIIALHKGEDIKKAMPEIMEAVRKVNSMAFSEIEKEYKKFENSYELKPKPKREGLPDLEFAEKGGKVITRFAPNPSGVMHLGHARQAILSHDLAKKYNGKFFLRFDDTDPKIKVPLEKGEELILQDLEWLGIKPDAIYRASDRFELYYEYMKKTIEKEQAYVCTCDNEEWKKKKAKAIACSCRELPKKENLERFEKMLNHEYKEGQAVLRIKTDLQNKDPSIRDWWAAKIVDKPQHPKASDRHLWPSYNFASAIDDHELGVTLIIRGQEHAQNAEKQKFLYKYFGWEYPNAIHTGRVKSDIGLLSKSRINALMKKKDFLGYSDPRLGTLMALRRRGFQAETIREIIIEIGLKTSDTTIEFKKIADLNKKFVASAERIAFLTEPIRLEVGFAQKAIAEIDGKEFELKQGSQAFLVDKKEIDKIEIGKIVRIRNAYNARMVKKDPLQAFAEWLGKSPGEFPVIHWLLEEQSIDTEIWTPKGMIAGFVDNKILEKKQGEIVYLEKFGYCRIDQLKENKAVLFWAHS